MLHSLRSKTICMIGVTLIGLLLILGSISRSILLDSFLKLERDDALQHISRVTRSIAEDQSTIDGSTRDLAYWDDAYAFAKSPKKSFIEANFSEDTFKINRWNVVMFLDNRGKILYGQGYDLKAGHLTKLPLLWSGKKLPDLQKLRPHELTGSVAGFMQLDEGPLIISVRNLLPTNMKGQPAGLMITGRFFDDSQVQRLSDFTRVPLKARLWSQPLDKDTSQAKAKFKTPFAEPLIGSMDEENLRAWCIIKGLDARPFLLMRLDLPRNIYMKGKQSLYYLLSAVVLSSLVFGGAVLWLLEKFVLVRVIQLSLQVKAIGQAKTLKGRVQVLGNDELSTLALHMNTTLEAHEKLHSLLDVERRKTQRLLINILPESVAERLKERHETIAESYSDVTVLFADIVGFTEMSASISPENVVGFLNDIFSLFDHFVEERGLEKIKTIGDAYMAVGGLPKHRVDHASAIAHLALDFMECLDAFNKNRLFPVRLRIGINTGSVVAGVIGKKKFLYDLWGDAVNTASRMESSCLPNSVHVSEETYTLLKDEFDFSCRGTVEIKGKGPMTTYFLLGRKADAESHFEHLIAS